MASIFSIKMDYKNFKKLIKEELNLLNEIQNDCTCTCTWSWDLCPDGGGHASNYFDSTWTAVGDIGMYGSTTCGGFCTSACGVHCANGTANSVAPGGSSTGLTKIPGDKVPQSVFNAIDIGVTYGKPIKMKRSRTKDKKLKEMYNQCFGTCVREEPHPITGGEPYQYTYFNTAPMPYHYGSSNCDEAIAAACATKGATPYGMAPGSTHSSGGKLSMDKIVDPRGPRKPNLQKLRKTIKRELHNIQENKIVKKYDIPPEIKDALEDKLKMSPLIRFVKNLKAVNSIPPSYRIFLLNGQYFDIYYESFSLMAKIGIDEYYLADLEERNYAIKHINRLMTKPIPKIGDDQAADAGETATPPASPTDEPTPEPEA